MVEFCHTIRPFTDAEHERAATVLLDTSPAHDQHRPKVTVWKLLEPVA